MRDAQLVDFERQKGLLVWDLGDLRGWSCTGQSCHLPNSSRELLVRPACWTAELEILWTQAFQLQRDGLQHPGHGWQVPSFCGLLSEPSSKHTEPRKAATVIGGVKRFWCQP